MNKCNTEVKINEFRINELISELAECREDERNTQNQILQVISLVGTILGILFGTSFLFSDNNNNNILTNNIVFDIPNKNDSILFEFMEAIERNLTYSRILFLLSVLVFSSAFTYIMVLGINNVLRYYYIQNLEDRLHDCIDKTSNNIDNNNRGDFLHWNEYIAPIITLNKKHITSIHTTLHYFCYTSSIYFIIIFSIIMVLALFLKISPKKWFDYLLIFLIITLMLITYVLFLKISSNAESVMQYAWNTAHENQKARLNNSTISCISDIEKTYKNSSLILQKIKYLICPRIKDFQKPLLIILGFIISIIINNINLSFIHILKLLFVLFTFEFLLYQARYQINDIRGIIEDEEAKCTNRIISNCSDTNFQKRLINISFILAIIKIIFSLLLILFFGGELKKPLLLSILILTFSTVLYELSKTKKISLLTYLIVGIGYPLRFFLGYITTYSYAFKFNYDVTILSLIIGLWAYGIFSSLLSWTNEITNRIASENRYDLTFTKNHFNDLHNIIKNRFNSYKNKYNTYKVLPLREKGEISDPWNIFFYISLISLFIGILSQKISYFFIILEIIFLLSAFLCSLLRKQKLAYICSFGILLLKLIIVFIFINILDWYFMICCLQIMIFSTYFILCYHPLFLDKKINIIKSLKIIKKFIIGDCYAQYFSEDIKD